MKHPKEGNVCYVAHQGIADLHRIFNGDFSNIYLWPESGLTITDLVEGRKYCGPVLTENPWIISNYDRKDVFIWKDGKWKNPDNQTFGKSVNGIMTVILGFDQTIPGNNKIRDKIIKQYQ